ncbi:hypothetical protein ABD72_01090 [Brevibacillus laterosporus]|nr:hypothetical protein BrL25_09285 [Brevibacillus laterosporus DSM 25]MBG9800837.1 hypothetical protein [Brevibacillus laterosporus]
MPEVLFQVDLNKPMEEQATPRHNPGEQYYLDAHLAYRRACLNAIEYLKTTMGYTAVNKLICYEVQRPLNTLMLYIERSY